MMVWFRVRAETVPSQVSPFNTKPPESVSWRVMYVFRARATRQGTVAVALNDVNAGCDGVQRCGWVARAGAAWDAVDAGAGAGAGAAAAGTAAASIAVLIRPIATGFMRTLRLRGTVLRTERLQIDGV